MKKYSSVFILVISILCVTKFSFALDIESFTVNGLKIIFKKNTSTDIVSANLYFKGGVMVVDPRQSGIEPFALIVAQKATSKYPKNLLNAALEQMNTKITSAAGVDFSNLSLLCVKQNFEKSWDIFADILINPLFNEDDVELEREKILSLIKQTKDTPDNYLRDLANKAFYTNHPYMIEVDGTEETVSSFTADQLKTYMKSRTQTSNLLLVVVGNTSKGKLEELVKKDFGKLETGTYIKQFPAPVKHTESSIKIVSRDLPTNYIRGDFPAPAFGSEEWYSMSAATRVLRYRLFEEVRTKRSLSYAPAAGYPRNFSGYAFIYVTAVDPDTTIKVMVGELEKIKNEPISEKELTDQISTFITSFYLENETNQSQAHHLAIYELCGSGYEESGKFIENLKKITPESVQKVCQKYIKNLQFVLLGNPKSLSIENFMY